MLPNYSIFSIGDSKIDTFLEAVLNLFRDRLSPMLKQIGVRDMQPIAAIDKNQGILDSRQGRNMAGTYLLAMIILFLYKFKTASKYIVL